MPPILLCTASSTLRAGLVDRGDHQVLEHLGVVGIEHLAVDLHPISCLWPFMVTATMPPPTAASTSSVSSSRCRRSCIS